VSASTSERWLCKAMKPGEMVDAGMQSVETGGGLKQQE